MIGFDLTELEFGEASGNMACQTPERNTQYTEPRTQYSVLSPNRLMINCVESQNVFTTWGNGYSVRIQDGV